MINREKIIDLTNVTKKFGDKIVVDHVDMQIYKGEIVGFLGPNGSGKTTTMRMICGLLKADEGEGTCLGYEFDKIDFAIKKKIGYMTQKFSLYEDLSIRQNLEFVARVYNLDNVQELTNKTLEKLGLQDRQHQLTGQLSGGWKQRLALASSIIHEPELLLLDEPTAGVDPKARRDFWDQIHQLASQGLTVLVSTHYMDEAERCHRIAYILYGKMMEIGTISEVIERAGLHTWIVEGERLEELTALLKNMEGIDYISYFGNLLHVTGRNKKRLEDSLNSLKNKKQYKIYQSSSTLEDVFISYMENRKNELD